MADDDEEPMLECDNCGLRYQVIFCNDAMAMGGDGADQFCPRCGDDIEATN